MTRAIQSDTAELHSHGALILVIIDWDTPTPDHASDATTATLAYRIVSFWLPLAAGPFAWLTFRWKYPRRPTPAETGG